MPPTRAGLRSPFSRQPWWSLIGAAGLAFDAGRGYMVNARLSQAVDAAALAGGRSLTIGGGGDYAAQITKYFDANFPARLHGRRRLRAEHHGQRRAATRSRSRPRRASDDPDAGPQRPERRGLGPRHRQPHDQRAGSGHGAGQLRLHEGQQAGRPEGLLEAAARHPLRRQRFGRRPLRRAGALHRPFQRDRLPAACTRCRRRIPTTSA